MSRLGMIRSLTLGACILAIGLPWTLFAQDRFVSTFPRVVFEAWLESVDAQKIGDDEVGSPTLLGNSIVRTYSTRDGERRIELHLTEDGAIYDVGEHLALGPLADAYLSREFQIIASRIIWSTLVGDEAYLRSVVASNYIRIETPFLGSKESQLLQFVRQNPGLHPGNFYLSVDEESQLVVSEMSSSTLIIRITPTLDLLLQGQSVLYRDHLVAMITRRSLTSGMAAYEASTFYGLTRRHNAFSYRLPEMEYYTNERSFSRKSSADMWVPTTREQLAVPEGRIASLVAHRWATLSLPAELRYRDVLVDSLFSVELTIEGKQTEKATLMGEAAVDHLGSVIGNGLPAYYNTISARKGKSDEVVVRGIWMVRHPVLAFEHIFRITDTFIISPKGAYVWSKSDIRAVLAVRMDHVQQLKAPTPPRTAQAPLFRVKVNR